MRGRLFLCPGIIGLWLRVVPPCVCVPARDSRPSSSIARCCSTLLADTRSDSAVSDTAPRCCCRDRRRCCRGVEPAAGGLGVAVRGCGGRGVGVSAAAWAPDVSGVLGRMMPSRGVAGWAGCGMAWCVPPDGTALVARGFVVVWRVAGDCREVCGACAAECREVPWSAVEYGSVAVWRVACGVECGVGCGNCVAWRVAWRVAYAVECRGVEWRVPCAVEWGGVAAAPARLVQAAAC